MPGVKAPALLAGIYKPCSGICVILFFRLSQYYLAARATPLDGHYLIVVQERLDERERAAMVRMFSAQFVTWLSHLAKNRW